MFEDSLIPLSHSRSRCMCRKRQARAFQLLVALEYATRCFAQPGAFGSRSSIVPSATFGDRPFAILLGDSIIEEALDPAGWGALLSAWFSRRLDVLVRGFGGANTRHLLAHASHHIAVGSPRGAEQIILIIICIGANDASAPGRQAHVPLPEFEANLDAILEWLSIAYSHAQVVLVTPPAVDEEAIQKFPWYHADGRTLSRTKAYALAVKQRAQARDLPCFDIYTAMLRESAWQLLLRDGLHLSAEGSIFAFEGLRALLRESGLHSDALPIHIPPDPATYEKAFNSTECAWPGRHGWYC